MGKMHIHNKIGTSVKPLNPVLVKEGRGGVGRHISNGPHLVGTCRVPKSIRFTVKQLYRMYCISTVSKSVKAFPSCLKPCEQLPLGVHVFY